MKGYSIVMPEVAMTVIGDRKTIYNSPKKYLKLFYHNVYSFESKEIYFIITLSIIISYIILFWLLKAFYLIERRKNTHTKQIKPAISKDWHCFTHLLTEPTLRAQLIELIILLRFINFKWLSVLSYATTSIGTLSIPTLAIAVRLRLACCPFTCIIVSIAGVSPAN